MCTGSPPGYARVLYIGGQKIRSHPKANYDYIGTIYIYTVVASKKFTVGWDQRRAWLTGIVSNATFILGDELWTTNSWALNHLYLIAFNSTVLFPLLIPEAKSSMHLV